ncbi:hypothetical protein [Natrinema soli]|uniref:Replication protein A C-terminal domain-containing protein n=1 Tax=Natrinema soli TaxID=1930624 RepID=A0ABD5SL13_9EURY|nr:hypothetical protein [Natrinema soli]
MHSLTQTCDARNALLSRLEESNNKRTELIDAVTEAMDVDREVVEDIADQLEAHGEIYVVNGVVKKT